MTWRLPAIASFLVAPAVLLSGYHLFQLTLMADYAVAVLGLTLVTGTTGQISLGHGAFYAVGAYVEAILTTRWQVPFWAGLPAAAAVCAGLGVCVGLPALRLAGPYLALVTFALAVAVPQILRASGLEAVTGGAQGLVLTPLEPPAWLTLSPDRLLYLVTVAVAALLFVLAHNLLRLRVLRAMRAVRDQPLAAEACGIDIARVKIAAFTLSAAVTGVAGALAALAVQFVAPDSFPVQLSIALFVGLVVGGAGSLPGAVIGAAFVQFVPTLAERLSHGAPGLVYGVLLIAALYLMPNGAASLFAKRR